MATDATSVPSNNQDNHAPPSQGHHRLGFSIFSSRGGSGGDGGSGGSGSGGGRSPGITEDTVLETLPARSSGHVKMSGSQPRTLPRVKRVRIPDESLKRTRHWKASNSLWKRAKRTVLDRSQWIINNCTVTGLKPVIRSALATWISLLFLLVGTTLNALGQVRTILLLLRTRSHYLTSLGFLFCSVSYYSFGNLD